MIGIIAYITVFVSFIVDIYILKLSNWWLFGFNFSLLVTEAVAGNSVGMLGLEILLYCNYCE